jgi:dTDP-4-dehydrorhamnose 3,5-epimerase
MFMRIENLKIPDLKLVHSDIKLDSRGVFMRLFCDADLSIIMRERRIVQSNYSHTIQPGAVRGMHFQKHPYSEMKMIRCIRGAVYDVAVDVRPKSLTYLKHVAIELKENDGKMLIIPEGFAHGFQTLLPNTELLYFHTATYNPEQESGLNYNDPSLNINWPMHVTDISIRDQQHTLLQS